MIDVVHVAIALVVLVVLVLLTIYVTDWALAKWSPIDPGRRLIIPLVTVLVFLILVAMILSFFPYWAPWGHR